MLILAAAALSAVSPQQPAAQPVAPQRQAQATVTILSSAALRFSEIEKTQPKLLRPALVRAADGSIETVKLVEFE